MRSKSTPGHHPAIPRLAEDLKANRISRRQFLRYATLLGMSATAAYTLAGKLTSSQLLPAAHAQGNLPQGGTLRIGMRVHEVQNPHAYNWLHPALIAGQVVGRLAVTFQDGISRPVLAESWEASDDLKTWTFKLRKINWHNGRPFTADDVIWNIEHIFDPATGSSSVGLMKGYFLKEEDGKTMLWDANAIEKIDDHTVRFNLKEPQVAIPEHMDHYTNAIIDPEENGQFGVGSNGLMAFELVDHAVGERAILKARKDEPFFLGGPYLDTLEFIDLGDDANANLAGLASGQVQALYETDVFQMEAMEAMPGVVTHSADTANTSVVQMKVNRPPYDNPLVRTALRYATDSKRTLEVAHRNLGLPGEHHFVCPVHPDYAVMPEMGYDPEKAKALLAEAGYPDGIDIEIAAKKDPNWEIQAVQAMVEQWKVANIRCKINVLPSAQFWDVWDKVDLGFVEWAHRPLGFMVLSLGFRTGVPWNAPEYANPEFDRLLTEAEGTLDLSTRQEIMAKIQKIMQEDGPITQPVWRALTTATSERVKGFTMHPQRWFYGHELAIES